VSNHVTPDNKSSLWRQPFPGNWRHWKSRQICNKQHKVYKKHEICTKNKEKINQLHKNNLGTGQYNLSSNPPIRTVSMLSIGPQCNVSGKCCNTYMTDSSATEKNLFGKTLNVHVPITSRILRT